uniref:Uncharacterized protein n=1 Tax=Rousettus aegyptiacus TaxID=9407 RepID=A0A7J8BSL1_ROUAE|nr:hypothetical protein HJG63_009495 [Rousettus aegyptiacus]
MDFGAALKLGRLPGTPGTANDQVSNFRDQTGSGVRSTGHSHDQEHCRLHSQNFEPGLPAPGDARACTTAFEIRNIQCGMAVDRRGCRLPPQELQDGLPGAGDTRLYSTPPVGVRVSAQGLRALTGSQRCGGLGGCYRIPRLPRPQPSASPVLATWQDPSPGVASHALGHLGT